jgi:triosephosphate isomerase
MENRQQIAAGNWKMNKTFDEGIGLVNELIAKEKNENTLVILGTPFIHLKSVADLIANIPNMKLAGQNCHEKESGAYTGETSADMLLSVGADYVILGHSERREHYKESNEMLSKKVDHAISKGLIPIFCCGESLRIRKAKIHVDFVSNQLNEGLFHLSAEAFSKIIIAYEPIWAIGTGETASPEQAQNMHKEIRALIERKYGNDIAQKTSILYGGSVKPDNAKEIFSQPDVDGGLVGGASLNADDFGAIINSF